MSNNTDSSTTTLPGRRERKKAQTKKALEKAAFDLFAERGYDGTTLLDITEAADVAPRTFFRYFSSKEEIVLGSSQELTEALSRALRVRPADEPLLESVVQALGQMDPERQTKTDAQERARLLLRFTIMRESPDVRAGLLDSYGALEACIAQFAAERLGLSATEDIYPQMLGAAITAALRIALTTWAADGGKGDTEELFGAALAALRNGLEIPAAA